MSYEVAMEDVTVQHEAQPEGPGPLEQQAPFVPSTAVKHECNEAAEGHLATKAEAMESSAEAGSLKAGRDRLAVPAEPPQEVQHETTLEVMQQVTAEASESTGDDHVVDTDEKSTGGGDVFNTDEESSGGGHDDTDEEPSGGDDDDDTVKKVKKEAVAGGVWKQLLYYALGAAAPPSRFACSGLLESSAPFLYPDISVEGVGKLDMPLCKEQAATLKSVTEQAPHGKGLHTVVDTTVRDAFQVDASKVHIGSSWQPVLQSAVANVAKALDIAHASSTTTNLEARLYKLLLYEQGGHFTAHQDTEKEKGMIGTLVVQLPCCDGHTGGSLVVRHKGVQHTHDFSQDSATSMQYIAFFADCEHELTPLTNGMRLVLTYNLVFTGPAAAVPRLVGRSPVGLQLQEVLHLWEEELAAGSTQKRIAFLLEHEYTESNLSFKHLKGSDRAMVRALATCSGFDAHLVLVTRRVTGRPVSPSADFERHRYWCADDDDNSDNDDGYHGKGKYRMSSVEDDDTYTGKWVAMDGTSIDYGDVDPYRDFHDPDGDPLFGRYDEPDSENYQSYTGNEGAGLDQIYRRALLVIWPSSQTLANARRAGLNALLALLRLRMTEASGLQYSRNSRNGNSSNTALTDQQQGSGAASSQQNNSSSKAHIDEIAAELVAELEARGEEAGKMLDTPEPSYRSYSDSHQVATVLQLGAQAVQLGIQGAVPPVLKMLLSVCESKSGLNDEKLAKALASAACVLDLAAVGSYLCELVIREMAGKPAYCMPLIKGVAGQQELLNLLASAAVEETTSTRVCELIEIASLVPGLPAIQQAAMGRVTAAVQADASAHTAEWVARLLPDLQALPELMQQLASAVATALCAAGLKRRCNSVAQLLQACEGQQQVTEHLVQLICNAVSSSVVTWQEGGMMQLLQALKTSPAARQALLTHMLGCNNDSNVVNSSTLLSSQTDNSLLLLSELLLSEPELTEAFYARFAAAVTASTDTYFHLRHLLQTESVRAALDMPAVQQLVACQVANLERKSAVSFSWHMQEATMPGYPQVESFLQGPEESMILRGFSSTADAQNTASWLLSSKFTHGHRSYACRTYSITAQVQGTGQDACVMIRKTREYYELQLKSRQEFEQELIAVKSLLRNVPGDAGRATGLPAAAPITAQPIVRPVISKGLRPY